MKKSWLVLMSLCLFAVCAVVYAQSSTTKGELSKSNKAAAVKSSNLKVELAKVLLQLKDELELTDKQVEKIKKILRTAESKTEKSASKKTQSQGMTAMCQKMMKNCQEMMENCQKVMKSQQEDKGCCPMCSMMKK